MIENFRAPFARFDLNKTQLRNRLFTTRKMNIEIKFCTQDQMSSKIKITKSSAIQGNKIHNSHAIANNIYKAGSAYKRCTKNLKN